MPHRAGEGYVAIKQWIQDNLPEILAGEVPLDFGNPIAQRIAIDYLFKLLDITVPEEITEGFNLLFSELTPFPRKEEPTAFVQTLKSTIGGTLQKVRSFFSSAFNKLKSFFLGG
ncbi:MAG: hypothetical protein QW046_04475 [Candidatus Micrarchaeaceae archaeon]